MGARTLGHALTEPRLFTPDEANALLPRVRPLLVTLRDVYHEYSFAREQWEELEAQGAPSAEVALWSANANALGERVVSILEGLKSLGVVVKDPTLGLVDLHARHPDGSVVYLCYRDDESVVAHWHALDSGFAGRHPIDAEWANTVSREDS